MRRLQLVEIADQRWCPAAVRDALTDYLQFSLTFTNPYLPLMPRLQRALSALHCHSIVDLCSGAGGPWLQLHAAFTAHGYPVTVCLTDRHPNLPAFQRLQSASQGAIRYYRHPVDARHVPAALTGVRTMFASLHHFPPADARRILASAVDLRQGIAVFEATSRRVSDMLVLCTTPVAILLTTPWIRPFRWSRLVWTYLVPAVPLIALFDGIVSCLRTYTPSELRQLVAGLDDVGYRWQIGEERISRTPLRITYLIGEPTAEWSEP